MSIDWKTYSTWAHESGTRKSGPGVPDHERAALMHIWGLGLGGEGFEFLTEMLDWSTDPRIVGHDTFSGLTSKSLLEVGDILFYLARLYQDSGNVRRVVGEALAPPSLQLVCRHLGAVVECMKKAFRSEGENGLLRLCVPEHETYYANEKGVFKGRREEFGVLLDRALGAIEAWLVSRGSSLSAACEANVEKLVARRKAGLISAQGERVSELGKADYPKNYATEGGIPCGKPPEAVYPTETLPPSEPEAEKDLRAIITGRCRTCGEKVDNGAPVCMTCFVKKKVPGAPTWSIPRPIDRVDPVKQARLERADLQSRILPRPPEGGPEVPSPKRSG